MKKLILTIIYVLMLSNINAQLGWQIGYINSISKFDNKKIQDVSYEYNPATGLDWKYTYKTSNVKTHENGIQGGVTYDMKFNKKLSFLHVGLLPAITYSTSKFEFTDNTGNISSIATINTFRNTFEIPVELVGVIPQSKDVNVIVFIGPTFSIGAIMLENTENIGWSTGWYGQRFNLELGGGIGIQYKKATIKGAYDWGVKKYGIDNMFTDGLKISLGFII
jgi:hypothetical protein